MTTTHSSGGDHIARYLQEKNIILETHDPVVAGGFTQVPNFILENPDLSVGSKVVYAMFLRYAWNDNHCFPGQDTLAKHIGMSIGRVNQFIKELESVGLVEIKKRGQGKTNLYKLKFQVTKKKA